MNQIATETKLHGAEQRAKGMGTVKKVRDKEQTQRARESNKSKNRRANEEPSSCQNSAKRAKKIPKA